MPARATSRTATPPTTGPTPELAAHTSPSSGPHPGAHHRRPPQKILPPPAQRRSLPSGAASPVVASCCTSCRGLSTIVGRKDVDEELCSHDLDSGRRQAPLTHPEAGELHRPHPEAGDVDRPHP
jgi:hypothetical protein